MQAGTGHDLMASSVRRQILNGDSAAISLDCSSICTRAWYGVLYHWDGCNKRVADHDRAATVGLQLSASNPSETVPKPWPTAPRPAARPYCPPRRLGFRPPAPVPAPTPCTPVSFVSRWPPCSAIRLFVSSSANLLRSSFVECWAGSTVCGGGGTPGLGGVGTSYRCESGMGCSAGVGESIRGAFRSIWGNLNVDDETGGENDGPDRIRLVDGAPYGSEECTSGGCSPLVMYPCRIRSSRSRDSMSATRFTRVDWRAASCCSSAMDGGLARV